MGRHCFSGCRRLDAINQIGGMLLLLTVLAPAYNEEPVIEKFVHEVMRTLNGVFSFELIIVNDGSTDNTGIILERLQKVYDNLVVINHPINRGLGAGLKTGFIHARGEVIVTLDADLSQSPGLIPSLTKEIEKGADVVIGSRYVAGGSMEGVPRWRVAVSRAGNWAIRTFAGLKARDCTSGMRAYRKGVVENLKDIGTGFDVQLRILQGLKNAVIREVPLILVNRAAGTSKMRYFKLVPRYLILLAGIQLGK